MADPPTQFKLNIPPRLREYLDRAASASGRTLTAEIVSRLELTEADDRLAALERALAQVQREAVELRARVAGLERRKAGKRRGPA